MITSHDVRTAEHIIETSGIVDILLGGRDRSARGRKTNREFVRLYFIGGLLTVHHFGNFVITDVFKTLTEHLSVEDQLHLGVLRAERDETGRAQAVPAVSIHDLNYVTKALKKHLEYGIGNAPDLDDAERDRRHQVVKDYSDALMDVFDLGFTSATYAVDATGYWAWGKGAHRQDEANADEAPSARGGATLSDAA
jgi:hypothetical protein